MGLENVSDKLVQIVMAVLLATAAAVGIPLIQEQQTGSQSLTNDSTTSQTVKTEVKSESGTVMPTENTEQQGSSNYTLDGGVVIEITPSVTDGKISSPLTIKGTVPNSASDARFTIRLTDPNGKIISKSSVSASSSGSSSGTTNFSTTLGFSTAAGGTGSLQISQDGSANGDSITIPVVF